MTLACLCNYVKDHADILWLLCSVSLEYTKSYP